MKKTWCEHIRKHVSFDRLVLFTGGSGRFVGTDWVICPVCGALRAGYMRDKSTGNIIKRPQPKKKGSE